MHEFLVLQQENDVALF